jgi:hypothetical protein
VNRNITFSGTGTHANVPIMTHERGKRFSAGKGFALIRSETVDGRELVMVRDSKGLYRMGELNLDSETNVETLVLLGVTGVDKGGVEYSLEKPLTTRSYDSALENYYMLIDRSVPTELVKQKNNR